MKKTLFTSLFCAAITISSIAGYKNINKQQTPKINAPANRMTNVFDIYDGGGGGGGGGSGSSLPTYTESAYFEDATDYQNDYSYYAQKVGDRGKITGKLGIHNNASYTGYYNMGTIGQIDKDCYRFTVTEKMNYTFNFSGPNSYYYYELRRFSSNDNPIVNYNDNQQLIYSSKNSSTSKTIVLSPGTYFLYVTASNKNYVNSSQTYTLTFDRTTNPDGVYSLQLTESLLNSYNVIVWESDRLPAGVDRWKEGAQDICIYRDDQGNGFRYVHKGYLDPLYMDNTGWEATSLYFYPYSNPSLDSIMYIGNRQTIKDFQKIIGKVMDSLSIEAASKKIKSIRAEANAAGWNAAAGTAEVILTIILDLYTGGAASKIKTIFEKVTLGLDCVSAMNDLCEFISLKEAPYGLFTDFDYGANLQKIYDKCEMIINYDSSAILRIPKYSYLTIGEPNEYYNYPSGSKAIKWNSSFMLPSPFLFNSIDNSSSDYFKIPRGSYVPRTQYITVPQFNNGIGYTGNIRKFSNIDDFFNQTTPKTEWSDFYWITGSCFDYSISKRSNGKYYLEAKNTESVDNYLTYNATEVTSDEIAEFNLCANSYATEKVESGRTLRVCLEDRKYVYVRENANDYLRKITYTGWDLAFSGKTTFHARCLKLSVVKKVGSTWTIRIRNLTDENVYVDYNSRMCFGSHAENWSSSLSDIKHVTIRSYRYADSYADVQISENVWARYIGVSYVRDQVRYVSYAKGLDEDCEPVDYYTNTIY